MPAKQPTPAKGDNRPHSTNPKQTAPQSPPILVHRTKTQHAPTPNLTNKIQLDCMAVYILMY